MGYPGIIPDKEGDEIQGYVFSSTDLANHWSRLDEFEGEGYERLFVTVRVNGTKDVAAYVYGLKRDA